MRKVFCDICGVEIFPSKWTEEEYTRDSVHGWILKKFGCNDICPTCLKNIPDIAKEIIERLRPEKP